MSGIKIAPFVLIGTVAAAFAALAAAVASGTAVAGLRKQIARTLEEMSAGLQDAFPEQVRQARAWLDRQDLPDTGKLSVWTGRDELRRSRRVLEKAAAEGRQVQKALALALTEKAGQMAQHLAQQLAELESQYASGEGLLQQWLGQEEAAKIARTLEQARHLLQEERYPDLETTLAAFETELAGQVQRAQEQEEKHHKRLYLLKALRQVCAEMGFQEVTAPHYEREGDRGSRLLFAVDTVDQGEISFSLSLDTIHSASQIAEERCFEEFDQLSQYLEQEYGIQARFRYPGQEPPPRLRQKGEMDLPEGAGVEAAA